MESIDLVLNSLRKRGKAYVYELAEDLHTGNIRIIEAILRELARTGTIEKCIQRSDGRTFWKIK